MEPTAAPKAATITDVARLAGVSLSTVSRVMNGTATVDPALAAKVRKAAKALNYQASALARSLVSGRTQIVSVVVPDLANPTFQEILRGLSRAAKRENYHVLISDSAEVADEEQLLAWEMRRRTDGVILCAPRMPDSRLAELLPTLAPAVLVNRDYGESVPIVTADYRTALLELCEHLYELGHRHFVYLAGIPASSSHKNREAAVAEFRHLHTDAIVDELACGVGFEEGAAAADEVLATAATAVLAFNDLVAMGLMSALGERGVAIPGDISVVGFDDIPFARYTTPALTTASVPAAELGEQAWLEMSNLLGGGEPRHPISFRPRLRVRASSGVVAGGGRSRR